MSWPAMALCQALGHGTLGHAYPCERRRSSSSWSWPFDETTCSRGRGGEHPVALECDERRPHGHATREVPRPVDRVDDPADGAVRGALLLADEGIAWTLARDELAQRALHRAVGVGNR